MSKVLVIDDDAMNLKMAEFMLKKAGYEVLRAASGQEGIDLLKTEGADMVLLDVNMPEMDGYETLERIREDTSISDVKVFFLTATIDDEVQKKAEELSVISCINKPFKPDALYSALQ